MIRHRVRRLASGPPVAALPMWLAACAPAPQPPDEPAAGARQTRAQAPIGTEWPAAPRIQPLSDFVFACSDGPRFILHTVSEDSVEVRLPERVLRLERERSASGVKYRHDDVVVWTKGRQATLELGGERYGCRESRPESLLASARTRGVEFRATGNEPGWVLEIFPERMQLNADYGSRRVTTPRPRPERDASGATVLHTLTEAHDLRVRIEARECRDSMSGRAFSSSVTVELDGRRYRGCGQYLPSPSHGKKGTL